MHDRLEVLRVALKKDFPIVANTATTSLDDDDDDDVAVAKFPPESLAHRRDFDSSVSQSTNGVAIEPSEVNNALNVALCLLGSPKRRYFSDPDEALHIAESAATTALAWRISSLCSVLGARSYKYAKSRMCLWYEREGEEFLSAIAVTDEMRASNHRECAGDYDEEEDDDDFSVGSDEFDDDEDLMMLDKASFVMQHVALRQRR